MVATRPAREPTEPRTRVIKQSLDNLEIAGCVRVDRAAPQPAAAAEAAAVVWCDQSPIGVFLSALVEQRSAALGRLAQLVESRNTDHLRGPCIENVFSIGETGRDAVRAGGAGAGDVAAILLTGAAIA